MAVVGSSPEILVRLRNQTVTIRPVAGTRKRGATPDEDIANAANLMADVKERAEHLMLLDLGRNDVGRVSRPGTVRVKSNYEVEYYSHVMHIASQVEAVFEITLMPLMHLSLDFQLVRYQCAENPCHGID